MGEYTFIITLLLVSEEGKGDRKERDVNITLKKRKLFVTSKTKV
jgi:hypothetical protein